MKVTCPSCNFGNIEGEDRCQQCLHSIMQKQESRPYGGDPFQKALMTAPVSDLLTGEDLLVARPTDTVAKIVAVFAKKKKTAVAVYEKKKLVGVISARDLVLRAAGKIPDLTKATAEDIMTRNPEWIYDDAPIGFAVNRMAVGGVRHLVVLRPDGTPASILLLRDILAYLSESGKAY